MSEDMERVDAPQKEGGDAETWLDPAHVSIKVEPGFESSFVEIIKVENFEDTENPEDMDNGKYAMSESAGDAETLMEPLFVPIKAEPDYERMLDETIMEGNFEASELTEEYSKGIKQWSLIENNTGSSSSQTLFQSLSTEVMRMNNENFCSKNVCASESGSKLLESLPCQKAFPIASTSSTSTTESTESQEDDGDDAGEQFSWNGEESVATLRQKEQSDQSEEIGCDNNQGTIPTQINERPFVCIQCRKAFSRKDKLSLHMRTHSGEKPYKCNQCGKSFTQSNNLTVHLRTHTGEEPYKCKQCGKTFSRKDKLTIHMRTHSGEKPFKCSQCDMSFTQGGNLTMHLRTHTGEEPYKCGYCDKAFKRSDTLSAHVRTHSGEKPYKCLQCGKSFTQCSSLNSHLRRHGGEEPH